MTLYAEPSAVLRWLFAEDGGEEIRARLAGPSKVATSRLTLIETRRVVRRAEREGRVSVTADEHVRMNARALGFEPD